MVIFYTIRRHGSLASETATFVFSLREPLLDRLQQEYGLEADQTGVRRNVSRLVEC